MKSATIYESEEEMSIALKAQVAGHMTDIMTEQKIASCIIITDLQGKGLSFAAIGSAQSISMSVRTLGVLDRENMSWWRKIFLGLWLIATCFS